MGFVALAVVGVLAFAAMVLLRLPRMLWSFAGAALFLGAAGYAWQGSPGLAAVAAKPSANPVPIEPAEILLRERLMGRYTADNAYLVASDAMLRVGDRRAAARVALGGVRNIPRSFVLWTQLGSNLAMLDGDQMSPAAKMAFGRAIQLAPKHPGPYYYAGMSYVRADDLPRARAMWQRAVALSAEGTDYRRQIAGQLMLLERYMAATAR